MSEVTEAHLAKLPRWAREHIASLERKLSAERDKSEHLEFKAVQFGDWEGEKVYACFGNNTHYTELPERTEVVFPTAGGHVFVRLRSSGEVELMGSRMVSISPQSGNLIRVKVVPR